MASKSTQSIDPLYMRAAEQAKLRLTQQVVPTTSKLIRKKCLDCSENYIEVKLCLAFDCPLWTSRFGVRPSTMARKRPDMVDPVHITIEAHKRGMRENGETSWTNPLTGRTEPLVTDVDIEPDNPQYMPLNSPSIDVVTSATLDD